MNFNLKNSRQYLQLLRGNNFKSTLKCVFLFLFFLTIIRIAYQFPILNFSISGDTLYPALHALYYQSGIGYSPPFVPPAPYIFPDLLLANVFTTLSIEDPLLINSGIISFNIILLLILLNLNNKNTGNKTEMTAVIYILMYLIYAISSGRNASLIFHPAFHVSTILISIYYNQTEKKFNFLDYVLIFLVSLSDRFFIIFYFFPAMVQYLASGYSAKGSFLLQLYKKRERFKNRLFIPLCISFISISFYKFFNISDITRTARFISPNDLLNRAIEVWDLITLHSGVNIFLMTFLAVIVAFKSLTNTEIYLKKQTSLVLALTAIAPLLAMIFINIKIEYRYLAATPIVIFILIYKEVLLLPIKRARYFSIALFLLVIIHFFTHNHNQARDVGIFREYNDLLQYIANPGNDNTVLFAPYFESRILTALQNKGVIPITINKNLEFVKGSHHLKDLKNHSFYLVWDRERGASNHLNKLKILPTKHGRFLIKKVNVGIIDEINLKLRLVE